METTCIGIDVSKATLDMYVLSSKEHIHVPNNGDGFKKIVSRIKAIKPSKVVMEATGGYEALCAAHLAAYGIPLAVVNPRQVRDFARAVGILAKTDTIDAQVLAQFARAVDPPCRPLPSSDERELKELLKRRSQLIDMRISESNRSRIMRTQRATDSIELVLNTINEEIARIDDDIYQLIQGSPVWQQKAELYKSVPSIGDGTAYMLIANLPELGRLNRREIASLVGLAPMNRDSGTLRGRRMVCGGRPWVRRALYMPTINAVRFNPLVRKMYDRLIQSGKPHKVAITACMRKLLTILNAIARDNTPWAYKIT